MAGLSGDGSAHEAIEVPAAMPSEPMEERSVLSSVSRRRQRKLPARFHDKNFTHDKRVPLPRHYVDEIPEPLPPVSPPDPTPSRLPRVVLIVRDTIRTAVNSFGLMREYPHRPSYDPDAIVHIAQLAARKPVEEDPGSISSQIPQASSALPPPWPHRNMTHWHFMSWLTNGTTSKSQGEAAKFIKLTRRDDFDPMELRSLDVQREFRRIDQIARDRAEVAATEGGDEWQSSSVEIEVPTGSADNGAALFTVPGLRFRSLVGIITSAFQEPIAR